MGPARTSAHGRGYGRRVAHAGGQGPEDRSFAEPIDLQTLAREAGYSRFHFARTFRRVYGETPRAYLTRRRVERAKDLLRSVNLTVTEVAELVGFRSLGSFSARFAELVGESPTAYRDRVVAAGGPPQIPGCFVLMWTRPLGPAEERNLGEAGASSPG